MSAIVLLIALALDAQARVVSLPSPQANVAELDLFQIQADMKAAGHQVQHIICSTKCEVTLSAGSPSVATLAPFFANAKTRAQNKAEEDARRQAILDKLRAGTATQPEIAEIVEKLIKGR